ncbi:MAG: simple sugar transport system substrate-binding protein [Clostridiales bacterium]|jgi:simple sugar transport system substrate-binding protein|nr:simple sugar transport system substrate-binding protein [Clostridiales bacterium]
MKKLLSVLLAVVMILSLAACGDTTDETTSQTTTAASDQSSETTSADDNETGGGVEDLLKQYFPDQMADGSIKVAVVRNLAAGDHTQQFLEGCTSEGEALGFTVDTFVTDGDNAKAQEAIAQVIQKDYDGLILSHGEAGYTYDSLLPAVEKGMKVVTFDSVPYKDGDVNNEILEGVTSTAQEDFKLAELSLGSIVANFDEADQPIKVIRAWMGPGIPPLDRRQTIYDKMVEEGKIEEVALVGPVDFSNARGGTQDALAAVLPRFPEGTVDAIWGSYDELAKGCLQALNDAGRTDIKIMSIDISNDDINLMLQYPDIWVSTAAVDPKLIGISNMRLIAAKFAGEETPDEYNLDAQLVETSMLNADINMTNIADVVDGWGQEKGVFDNYGWMTEIKAAVGG